MNFSSLFQIQMKFSTLLLIQILQLLLFDFIVIFVFDLQAKDVQNRKFASTKNPNLTTHAK